MLPVGMLQETSKLKYNSFVALAATWPPGQDLLGVKFNHSFTTLAKLSEKLPLEQLDKR